MKDAAKDIKDAQNSVPPIHLTVDTGFRNGEASIKAFVSVNLSLGDRSIAAQFQEIPLDLRMIEAERVGCMNWTILVIPHFLFLMDSNSDHLIWELVSYAYVA